MNKNNFKSIYPLANSLYGISMDESSFEDIALNGWALIGNRQTKLYKYTTSTTNNRIQLPCNVEFIEAVYSGEIESRYSELNCEKETYIESYIEYGKKSTNSFYNKGTLVSYRIEGDDIVFDRDYANITILYHGIIVDDDGLPYITDKEMQALACYVAYADFYKKSLMLRDASNMQLAGVLKQDWLRLCNSARIPAHLTQNDLNDVLDVKTR